MNNISNYAARANISSIVRMYDIADH